MLLRRPRQSKDQLHTGCKLLSSWVLNAILNWSFVSSLSNLFNIIPRKSILRLTVFQNLLKIASENNDLEVLNLTPADVDRWLNEWEITTEQKSELLKSIADAYERVGQK